MTQFLYLSGPQPDLSPFPGLVAERVLSGLGVRGVEADLPTSELTATWEIVSPNGASEIADDWCIEAMEQIHRDRTPFHQTKLGRLLHAYIGDAQRITLSYAEDGVNNYTYRDPKEFMSYVEATLGNWACDRVNARYLRDS